MVLGSFTDNDIFQVVYPLLTIPVAAWYGRRTERRAADAPLVHVQIGGPFQAPASPQVPPQPPAEVRPIADRLVLEILERRALARGDVFETREGVCRIGSRMAGELAALAPEFRDPLGPHAEQLARSLTPTRRQATPLTRANHRHAIAKA
jgi:hypothetical protein